MTRHTRSSVPRVSMYAGFYAAQRSLQRKNRLSKRRFFMLLAVLAIPVYWLARTVTDFFEGAIR